MAVSCPGPSSSPQGSALQSNEGSAGHTHTAHARAKLSLGGLLDQQHQSAATPQGEAGFANPHHSNPFWVMLVRPCRGSSGVFAMGQLCRVQRDSAHCCGGATTLVPQASKASGDLSHKLASSEDAGYAGKRTPGPVSRLLILDHIPSSASNAATEQGPMELHPILATPSQSSAN